MNEQNIVWIYIPTYAAAKEQTQILIPGSANKNLKSVSDTIWQCCFALDLMLFKDILLHCHD